MGVVSRALEEAVPSFSYVTLVQDSPKDLLPFLFSYSGGILLRDAVSPERVKKWHSATGALFSLKLETLEGYARKQPSRFGYTKSGVEGVRREKPNERRHFFDFLPGTPTPLQDFSTVMSEACRNLRLVAENVLFLLGDRTNKLPEVVEAGEGSLRVAQYLNTEVDPFAILFPPHLDWSLVTLFVGGVKSGLSVECKGRWHRVEIPEDAVLVGAGTTLKLYRPEISPLRHRVMADVAKRISLSYFMEPHHDAILPTGERVVDRTNRIENKVRHEF